MSKYFLQDDIARCENEKSLSTGMRFYFKDSLLKQAGINREDLPSNCVCRKYSIF